MLAINCGPSPGARASRFPVPPISPFPFRSPSRSGRFPIDPRVLVPGGGDDGGGGGGSRSSGVNANPDSSRTHAL